MRDTRSRRTALACAPVLLALVTGCGGSVDVNTSATISFMSRAWAERKRLVHSMRSEMPASSEPSPEKQPLSLVMRLSLMTFQAARDCW